MTKGINYKYQAIEDFANKHNYELFEYGDELIGEHFVKLSHVEVDTIISFILVGMDVEYIYECIYCDV